MKRRVAIERVYNLGNYSSLRIVDEIDEIPQELMLKEEFAGNIRRMLLSGADRTYYEYIGSSPTFLSQKDISVEEAAALAHESSVTDAENVYQAIVPDEVSEVAENLED